MVEIANSLDMKKAVVAKKKKKKKTLKRLSKVAIISVSTNWKTI